MGRRLASPTRRSSVDRSDPIRPEEQLMSAHPARILVLTQPGDPHADHVVDLLRRRDARVVVFDPADFPVHASISVGYTAGGAVRRTLDHRGGRIDLSAVDTVWFRRPRNPRAHPEVTAPAVREYVERECEAMTSALWDDLDCLAVPGTRAAIRQAARKTAQLTLAGRLGFELPPTIVTTSPDEFLDFWDRHEGQVISKPLDRPFLIDGDDGYFRMCEPVTTTDLGYAEAMRLCPMIVQGYVPKQIEVRVTVVGQRVLGAAIHSQDSNHTRLDWRSYDPSTTRYSRHELPAALAALCRSLVAELELQYGTIDLILTPDGRYVFLEINPSGQWLWIEDATGLPISDALCELLLDGAHRSRRPAVQEVPA
ncbi:hypothetical protein RAJCM14343_5772 [Rhodococcus aetherivorans]|uniref:ATP-grasp domain-containing protein n=2 Tax=Rhodococcus aetherivorans TaxID=191292 RepID=A0ABQ0YVA9_9NOCA|nr:ATP-dependent carboxylate-amine ligase [Rhodococcus sp. WB1]NGP25428.1 ATP-dependent carboxylate-amine ligase [Rhodococcus aetherivorans]PND48881.1 ATP-dependent carboxylate-amine ligase [Rhodococcus sp. ENV425]USC17818.1 ATP-dependent carboxylate-amine ligase [Rhodococcus sp. 11-3]GES40482.1 hypothetical protein RAJCM14343_5772 [Rhodococcus aetherivorans]